MELIFAVETAIKVVAFALHLAADVREKKPAAKAGA
jgi:hypothetical protein